MLPVGTLLLVETGEDGYEGADAEFVDVALSENPQKYKSETWQHFLRDTSTERAKCRHCSAILKTSKGST